MITVLKSILLAGLTAFLIFSLLMCKDELNTDAIVFPESNVSYHSHVEPLFLRACAIPGGCHTSDYTYSDLSLETYYEATNNIGIIIPGDPDNSRLVLAIEGKASGIPRMPLNRSPLNSNQIKGIRKWIAEGAQNN